MTKKSDINNNKIQKYHMVSIFLSYLHMIKNQTSITTKFKNTIWLVFFYHIYI
ncbi:hypothetical protein M153_1590003969 [Pseudoloma neurophilia]|uniref:Uncharacterized protein n=1 Tax=Pseudoloma neurophilia TaxID=146866 RepID=A0A0R0M3N2_9MICR|nr:hypothetical protein M153_1590003969 [Pseudoloma neurophilia]